MLSFFRKFLAHFCLFACLFPFLFWKFKFTEIRKGEEGAFRHEMSQISWLIMLAGFGNSVLINTLSSVLSQSRKFQTVTLRKIVLACYVRDIRTSICSYFLFCSCFHFVLAILCNYSNVTQAPKFVSQTNDLFSGHKFLVFFAPVPISFHANLLYTVDVDF